MKIKIFVGLLCAVMVFALCARGGNEDAESQKGTSAVSDTTAANGETEKVGDKESGNKGSDGIQWNN